MAAMTVKSTKDKKKYVDDSYMYVLDKPSMDGTKLFWRCDKINDNCKVKLHTNTRYTVDGIMCVVSLHTE